MTRVLQTYSLEFHGVQRTLLTQNLEHSGFPKSTWQFVSPPSACHLTTSVLGRSAVPPGGMSDGPHVDKVCSQDPPWQQGTYIHYGTWWCVQGRSPLSHRSRLKPRSVLYFALSRPKGLDAQRIYVPWKQMWMGQRTIWVSGHFAPLDPNCPLTHSHLLPRNIYLGFPTLSAPSRSIIHKRTSDRPTNWTTINSTNYNTWILIREIGQTFLKSWLGYYCLKHF